MCSEGKVFNKMSVSPNTLNNLYAQGIIDYTPYDLCGGANVSSFAAMANPYMNSAMQGSLYQNYGMAGDSFNSQIPQGGMGMYGFGGGIGFNNPQAGMNGFGGGMSFNNSPAGINGFGGGFGELGNSVSKMPSFIKGLASGAIIIGTLALCLRGGKKKAPVNTESFWSKLKFWKK